MNRSPPRSAARPARPSSADPPAARAALLRTDGWYAAAENFPFPPPLRGLTEAPGNIIFGFTPRGGREDLLGLAELDQIARIHEGGVIRAARRLLHVVRHY